MVKQSLQGAVSFSVLLTLKKVDNSEKYTSQGTYSAKWWERVIKYCEALERATWFGTPVHQCTQSLKQWLIIL